LGTVLSKLHAKDKTLEFEGFEIQKGLDGNTTHEIKTVVPIVPNSQDMKDINLNIEAYLKGDIKIHGFPNNHRKDQEKEFLDTDWTVGCIAVSDFEIDELYKWVIENCPILILP
jgi:hypothetical protein